MFELNLYFETKHLRVKFWIYSLMTSQVIEVTTSKMQFFENYLATNKRIYSMFELNLYFETTHHHVKFWFDWLRTTRVIEVTTSKNAVF
jgi:hypothetical protein